MTRHNARPRWFIRRPHITMQDSKASSDTQVKPIIDQASAEILADADAARDVHDWAAAATKYREYLAQQPQVGGVWVQFGHALKELGNHLEAETAYRRAIALMADPTDPELHLAHMLKDAGRTTEARELLEKIERAMKGKIGGPGQPPADILLVLGDLARDNRDWLAAAKYYESYLSLRPQAVAIWVQLGHARKEVGNFGAAKTAYQEACNADPNSMDALEHLSSLARRLEDVDCAAPAYARMLEIDPSATGPYLELVAIGCRDLAYASVMRTAPITVPTNRIDREQADNSLAIFTIACSNYLSHVRTFVQSARRQYPEARIFFCLAERSIDPLLSYPQDCEIVLAGELGIQRFADFSFRYDVMEFNTALKPFMFRFLTETLSFESILYFDPDIEIFHRSEGILDALHQGASFVLTPHLINPAGLRGEPDDVSIMRSGVFNLGFMAVGRNEESARLLQWWSHHLQFQCVNEPDTGIFVDQKFTVSCSSHH